MALNRLFAIFIIIGTFLIFHPARMQYTLPYAVQSLFKNSTYTRSFNANHLKHVTTSPFFAKGSVIATEVRETNGGRLKVINHFADKSVMNNYICHKNVCSNAHSSEIMGSILFVLLLIYGFSTLIRGRSVLLE